MLFSSALGLWLLGLLLFVVNLLSLPRGQRTSHPSVVIGGTFLVHLFDGAAIEIDLARPGGGEFSEFMLFSDLLVPATWFTLLCCAAFVVGTRVVSSRTVTWPAERSMVVPIPSEHASRLQMLLLASTLGLQFLDLFFQRALIAQLFTFDGGRGQAGQMLGVSAHGFPHYLGIAVSLWTSLVLTWLWVRAVAGQGSRWVPVVLSILPLWLGLATASRSPIFQIMMPIVIATLFGGRRVPWARAAAVLTVAVAGILLVLAFRNHGKTGIYEFSAFVQSQPMGELSVLGVFSAAAGGVVRQTTAAMYLTAGDQQVGVLHFLGQLNPLPTFLGGRVGNEQWFQEALGISPEAVGITVPLIPDLFLDLGWWGPLVLLGFGAVTTVVYRKVLASMGSTGRSPRNLFPTAVVLYAACIYAGLLSAHTSTRGVYRFTLDTALACLLLDWLVNKRFAPWLRGDARRLIARGPLAGRREPTPPDEGSGSFKSGEAHDMIRGYVRR